MLLESSTKPQVHRKFEIFLTNIASTMACPNFKNGPKTGLRPLGVNIWSEKPSILVHFFTHIGGCFKYYLSWKFLATESYCLDQTMLKNL
jgi:hypothetical protein